jgi:hypothetical protein
MVNHCVYLLAAYLTVLSKVSSPENNAGKHQQIKDNNPQSSESLLETGARI